MRLHFEVDGLPAPQGSKRHVGNGHMVESASATLAPWREDVTRAARAALESAFDWTPGFDGPIMMRIVFWMPRPLSAPRTIDILPKTKPDLSKLIRSTEDALTVAGVWSDDARVTTIVATERYVYVPGRVRYEQRDFHRLVTGAEITLREDES